MKIDRRCFLSLGIGAAAGTVLSPLPWKITDDLSIWSQMWPWVPIPAKGEVQYVDSVSSLCGSGCGIRVRKVADRAVKIEGRDDYPGSGGGVCILCEAGLQLLYGPTRIQAPLKRVGQRGGGSWKTVTWEEAVGEVAQVLGGLREAGKPQALACITGDGRGTVPALFERFATAFGSPNHLRPATMEDTYRAAFRLLYGADAIPGFDLENADYVLSFGCGLLEGWGSTNRLFQYNSARVEKGATLVQVEPRLSNTAAKASRWVPVAPGGETALALAMAHVILKESLYDKGFAKGSVSGFDAFQKLVNERFSPAHVVGATGIEPVAVAELAREFAKAKHPVALCGRGKGERAGGLGETVAVHILNVLVGSVNRSGGVCTMPALDYIQWPDPVLDEAASAGLETPRIDGAGPLADQLLHRFPGAVADIEALLVCGANPAFSLPDTDAVRAALEQIPFVASFATHMDETAALSDLILPVHSPLERWEDIPAPAALGKPVIGLSRPVVDIQFRTRHPGDAIMDIARALEGTVAESFPWEDYETCLKETLDGRWETMEETGFWQDDEFQPGHSESWFEALVGTSTPIRLDGNGADLQQILKAPAPEGDEGGFPLVLLAYDTIRISGGAVGTPPFLMKTVPESVLQGDVSVVEVNPQTAAGAGLEDGDPALLATPKGEARVRVHVFDGIRPGVVALPRGLGHTAFDGFLAEKGVNVNRLMGSVEDPNTGLDSAWGIRASLSKA